MYNNSQTNLNYYDPQCPQPSQYCAVPTVPVEVVQASNNFAAQALVSEQNYGAAKNEILRLKQQLARVQAAEDAYTEILERDDRVFVVDKSGRMIELLSHPIASAVHFVPAPPFSGEDLYEIALEGVPTTLRLTTEIYFNDRRFLHALSELPGVRVSFLRRSVGLTATTLRLAFARKMRVVQPHFWGGWRQTQTGQFCFCCSVLDGKTHTSNSAITKYVTLDGFPTSVEAVTSARNLWNIGLAPVINPQIRWLTMLVLHVSCLYSLLRQLSYPFVGAFCFFSDDAAIRAFFKSLFQWDGDPALSLDDPPVFFNWGMLERKDEPLLVFDSRSTANAKVNSMRLEEALHTAQVFWNDRQGGQFFPLQGLPIILSDAVSSLVCAPQVLLAELCSGDFDVCAWSDSANDVPRVVAEHVNNFLRFAQDNVSVLQDLLEAKNREVLCGRYGLSPRCTQIFGVLLAVDAFVGEYLHLFRLRLPANVCDEEARKRFLLELLRDADEREDCCTDLVGQFIAIVRADFANHKLHARAKESVEPPADNTVFFDDAFLYFTSGAFCSVCSRLSCSRPTLVHALDSAGFLRGTPTNQSTAKTRIRVPGADGSRRTISVYMFAREIFDRFGDPLMFEEEDA